ncbi:MAG: alanine:cation symporter family protein [Clostridia bacterium]|nr:alanine:cation symporter family protein [Clostridia bacterium]
MSFSEILTKIDDWVWGIPLIALILIVGILLTLRSKGVQFLHLGKAFKFMFKDEEGSVGEVSSFGALCTALSATIGTGNIVGVATAICTGGPGALFWMEVAALFGMATKYAEGLLAVKYREVGPDGKVLGGPFFYIEKGLGKGWKWLAVLFAIFGLMAGLLGIGTITQVNGIASAVQNFFDPAKASTITLFGNAYPTATVIAGIIVTICVALVIIGGLKRIAKVSEIIVPFMAILYVLCGLTIIICNITKVPAAIVTIVQGAFNPAAVTGGVVGTIFIAMQKGIARGIFSNEAGLGSAPIAAAAARTKEPVRQGLVCMTGTFIDTIIVCTMTGLAIVLTGAWQVPGLEGAAVTSYAFQAGLPFLNPTASAFVMMICLAFFAFTTILGWDYYSERCLQYLVGDRRPILMGYKVLYIIAVFIGPYLTVSEVWTLADIVNGLMAFPNVIALILLSGVVARETKDYIVRYKSNVLK